MGMAVNRGPRVSPLWSGLVAAVALVVAMVGVVISGLPGGPGIPIPWNHTMTVKVQLANADALEPHASVDIAGVKVGDVQSVAVNGNLAVATLNIDPQYGDLHTDAQVLLRPHGLFGPKYIEISPGTSGAPAVRDGDTLAVGNTVQPVDLDQVLQALNGPESQNLRTVFVELGKAAAGQGDDVNHLLGAANTVTRTLQNPLNTLDSVAPNLNDFIVQNEAFNASFAQTPLDQLVASSNVTLAAFAAQSEQLSSLLVHADSTLTSLDSAFSGESGNLRSAILTLPSTIDKLNTFNSTLGLFGANLTGKESAPSSQPRDVTQGIIDAIENIKSAFSAFDCTITTVGNAPCPEQDRRYYLRVQTFNVAPTSTFGGDPTGLCKILNPGIGFCKASFSATKPSKDMLAGDYGSLSTMLAS